MRALQQQALESWGIQIIGIKFTRLQYSDAMKALYAERFQRNIETRTEERNVEIQNKIAISVIEDDINKEKHGKTGGPTSHS